MSDSLGYAKKKKKDKKQIFDFSRFGYIVLYSLRLFLPQVTEGGGGTHLLEYFRQDGSVSSCFTLKVSEVVHAGFLLPHTPHAWLLSLRDPQGPQPTCAF